MHNESGKKEEFPEFLKRCIGKLVLLIEVAAHHIHENYPEERFRQEDMIFGVFLVLCEFVLTTRIGLIIASEGISGRETEEVDVQLHKIFHELRFFVKERYSQWIKDGVVTRSKH